MPDITAVDMTVDTTGKLRPALSATSDLPKVIDPPKEPAAAEPAKEPAADAVAEPTDEPAKEPAKVVKEDTTPPALKAEITRERNRRRAADERAAKLETDLSAALEVQKSLAAKIDSREAAETAKKAEAEAAADTRPKRETFDNPDAYDQALIDWSGRQASRIAKAEADKEHTEATKKAADDATAKTQKEYNDKLLDTWNTRRAKAMEEMPDFVEVAEAEGVRVTNEMAFTMMHAENGPEVAYFLGKNPETAKEIAALSPPMQIFRIGQISSELSRPKPNISKAPKPIEPLGGRQTADDIGREPTMEEYARARDPQIKAGRRPFVGGNSRVN